jgi:hypothetical protein
MPGVKTVGPFSGYSGAAWRRDIDKWFPSRRRVVVSSCDAEGMKAVSP